MELHLVLFTLFIVSVFTQRYNWTKPEDLNRGLPSSVEIFILNMTNSPFGVPLTGGFARFNMSDPNLEYVVRDENED